MAEGPTDEDLDRLWWQYVEAPDVVMALGKDGFRRASRAVLAADRARWGRPTPQPVAEGPNADELIATEREACAQICDKQYERARTSTGAARADACATAIRARALLDQPMAERPTDEELEKLAEPFSCVDEDGWTRTVYDEAGYARAVLARFGRPTPQPVAASERLPGPEDCEAGECWAWDVAAESWNRTHYALCNHFTHWLPANALPIPEATND